MMRARRGRVSASRSRLDGGGGAPPQGSTEARRKAAGVATDDWYRGGDPGYYNEIFVDAHDPETIWSTQTNIDRSTDGGKTWTQVPLPGVHVDHHDIVFDPSDPKHYIIAQRRGPLRVVGRTEDVPSLHEPAALAVLPGIDRQREAVLSRLRRRTGQRIDLRSVAHAQPRGHSNERLDQRRRRRRLPGARRSARIPTSSTRNRRKERSSGSICEPVRARPSGRTHETPSADRRHLAEAVPTAEQAGRGAGGQGGGVGGARRRQVRAVAVGRPSHRQPHSSRRLYFGGERVYRSDDRGDSWTAISADLTRKLDATKIPIMGKVWPPDSVAFNQATTHAQHDHGARRIAAARGAHRGRHRRRARADHGGRTARTGGRSSRFRACRSTPT